MTDVRVIPFMVSELRLTADEQELLQREWWRPPLVRACPGALRPRSRRLGALIDEHRATRPVYPRAMSDSLVDDAFAHHVWATLRLIDTCLSLTPEQLDAPVPGTYGSILETMRHSVGGDTYYLSHLPGDPAREIGSSEMDLRQLRAAMEADERTWIELLKADTHPGVVVTDVDGGGYERDASVGIRFAQALHHGTDHRSQICTAITMLGIEPPLIDVWAFGAETGRVLERPPTS
jgi:uncharacterized damage-inducible protein DinB